MKKINKKVVTFTLALSLIAVSTFASNSSAAKENKGDSNETIKPRISLHS
ncbi:hypothetical protein [Lysinibacillus sp. 54212]